MKKEYENLSAEELYKIADDYLVHDSDNSMDLVLELLAKSAELGYVEAQYLLGCIYYDGEGTEIDTDLAYKYLEMAVEHNHPDALNYMGKYYFHVEGDYDKALDYYNQALEAGCKDVDDEDLSTLANYDFYKND